MQIEVTFPLHIPIEMVRQNIMGNLKANSSYTCEVEFIEEEDGENLFCIVADKPEVFYLVGITASLIIEKFKI